MIPESHKDLLQSKALAHVATIGPDGRPESNPVWFGWDGEHVLFSTTKRRQKYQNLKRNPDVALSIVDPQNPYRYLEVRGKVARFDPDPNKAFIDAMAKKYLGQAKYTGDGPGAERVVVVIAPEHTTTMG